MSAVDCQVLPQVYDWPPECGDYAPGNILARRMRYIFEDTNGLFPPSRKSSRAPAANGNPNKFNSIYEVDFNGRFWDRAKEFRAPRPASDRLKKRSKLIRPERRVNSSTVFMNWQVPQRVLDNLPTQPTDTQKSDEKQKEEEAEEGEKIDQATKLPAILANVAPPKPSAANAPQSACSTPVAAAVRLPPRMERARTWEKSAEVRPSSQQQPQRRPATVGEGGKREKVGASVVVAPRAAELLKQSNSVERRIIEKALLLNEGSRSNDTLERALQPEAAVKMKKWLEVAPAEEREVVLKLFHSLSGSGSKRGQSSYEKQELYSKMMNVFKSGHTSYVSQSHPHFSKADGDTNLKHLRLLTPNTRKNFWMHTTWHHLPPYEDKDRGENISSHYERPHRPIPRHFVIHPDGFGS